LKIRKLVKAALIVSLIAIATTAVIFLLFYRPVSLGGDTFYEPVFTGSMEPAVPVGSIVIIKLVDPSTLQKGDIICFKLSGPSSITHRIINITNEGFITKGDANEDPDTWIVRKENVIGKVAFIIPYIGYLGYFVKTPLGFLILIVIPATLLIILEIRNIIKYRKDKPFKKMESTPQSICA